MLCAYALHWLMWHFGKLSLFQAFVLSRCYLTKITKGKCLIDSFIDNFKGEDHLQIWLPEMEWERGNYILLQAIATDFPGKLICVGTRLQQDYVILWVLCAIADTAGDACVSRAWYVIIQAVLQYSFFCSLITFMLIITISGHLGTSQKELIVIHKGNHMCHVLFEVS